MHPTSRLAKVTDPTSSKSSTMLERTSDPDLKFLITDLDPGLGIENQEFRTRILDPVPDAGSGPFCKPEMMKTKAVNFC